MPNQKSSQNNPVAAAVFVIIAGVLIVFLGRVVFDKVFAPSNSQASSSTKPAASSDTPQIVSKSDMNMSGGEFFNKYKNKLVEFDGMIQGTSTLSGAPKPHTTLLYGSSSSKGDFSDGSVFSIVAAQSTFDDTLKGFSVNNDSPYTTGKYPKVHVIARVDKFDATYSLVELIPRSNIDGSTPSIVAR